MSFINSQDPIQIKEPIQKKGFHNNQIIPTDSIPFSVVVVDSSQVSQESVSPIHSSNPKSRPAACVFVASLINGVSPQVHKAALEELFCKWSVNPIEVKVLVDSKNRPYAFVQYQTEKEAKEAIKNAQGALLNNRPIRCEPARVNRTLFLTPKSNINALKAHDLQICLEAFGELEHFLLAKKATLLPNTFEFNENEWFVRFVYREDAIAAYTDEKMKNTWEITWSQNIDDTLDNTRLDYTSIAVRNLDHNFSEVALKQRFERYGLIRNFVVYRPEIKGALPYAYIKYFDEKGPTEAVLHENGSLLLDHNIEVKIRTLVESFAVDDNVKTSDIRVPAASPPLIPCTPNGYRRHLRPSSKSPNRHNYTSRSYSDQGFYRINENVKPRYASAYDTYSYQNYFGLQGSLKSHLLLPPPPLHMSTGQVYPSLPEMSSLYHQHYIFGGNGYNLSTIPSNDNSLDHKVPFHTYNKRNYTSSYNQPFLMYPALVNAPYNYPPGIYSGTEFETSKNKNSQSKKGKKPMEYKQRSRRVSASSQVSR